MGIPTATTGERHMATPHKPYAGVRGSRSVVGSRAPCRTPGAPQQQHQEPKDMPREIPSPRSKDSALLASGLIPKSPTGIES